MKELRSPKGKRLTAKEVNAMINSTKRVRDTVLVGLLWVTGAKPNEILNLRKEDIAIGERSVAVRLPSWERIYRRPRLIDGHGESSFIELLVRFVESRGEHITTTTSSRFVNGKRVEVKNIAYAPAKDGPLFPISRQMLRIIIRDMGMKAFGIPFCLHNIKRTMEDMIELQRSSGILRRYNEK